MDQQVPLGLHIPPSYREISRHLIDERILHVIVDTPVVYYLQLVKVTNIHLLDVMIIVGFPLPTCGHKMPGCTKRLLECNYCRQIMDYPLPISRDSELILWHDHMFGQNLGLCPCSFLTEVASSRSCIHCNCYDENGGVGGIGLKCIIASGFVLASDNSREITVLQCGIDWDDSDGSDAVTNTSDS